MSMGGLVGLAFLASTGMSPSTFAQVGLRVPTTASGSCAVATCREVSSRLGEAVQGPCKVVRQAVELLGCGVERLRSGADSGPSRPETDRQVALTWVQVKYSPCR